MFARDRHPVSGLLYLQRRMAGQQVDHHARMRRIEMLDQDEGHAGAGREHGEQPAAGIESAGRGAEPDDGETFSPERRAEPLRQTPARPWASRSSLSRTPSCHSNARSLGIAHRRSLGVDMRPISIVLEG